MIVFMLSFQIVVTSLVIIVEIIVQITMVSVVSVVVTAAEVDAVIAVLYADGVTFVTLGARNGYRTHTQQSGTEDRKRNPFDKITSHVYFFPQQSFLLGADEL